jgi:tetratricopeptide (TPR) repeat protein
MEDYKQELFDQAFDSFFDGRIDDFVSNIENLFNNHLTCNCFFKEQPSYVWGSLFKESKKIPDNNKNYNLNLAKGFICLRYQENSLAYTYLTNAININPDLNIGYSIRACIDRKNNPHNLRDSEKTLSIYPSVYSYFIAGNIACDTDDFEKAITYFDKAISINSNAACAYSNKAYAYDSLKKYDTAIKWYLKALEIDISNWCGELIMAYLIRLSRETIVKHIKTIEYIIENSNWGQNPSYGESIEFFQGIVIYNNPECIFSELNPHWVRIDSLKNSYLDKSLNDDIPTEEEENSSKLFVYEETYHIGFGRYANMQLKDVIDLDPQYILWCVINLVHFCIKIDLFFNKQFKNQVEYLEALEINIIKNQLVIGWERKLKELRDRRSDAPFSLGFFPWLDLDSEFDKEMNNNQDS